MNYSHINVIVKIAETGSFTRAGDALHMTQPAVSRAVLALETQLGTKLIVRNKKTGIMFTDVGERLLVIFRNIIRETNRAEEIVAMERGLEIGKVHIGAFPMICTQFLPKIIRFMQENHPGLEITLSEGSDTQIKKWLAEKSIDLGIVIAPSDGFDVLPLLKDQLIIVFAKNHPLLAQEYIAIPDLEGEDIILGRGGYDLRVHALFEQFGLKPSVRFTVDHIDTALSMVQEGLGVVITSKKSITSLPNDVRCRNLTPDIFREIQIAVPEMASNSKATEVLIRTTQQLFGEQV